MPDEPFLLVSLEEAKAKKLAQVLNNETCTKLLNYLSTHKEATESELAKKLKLPLSTVHYNLKQLVEARLVLADEYHYSEKGREVNHYKLANKYIIIAPNEGTGGFLDRLKTFLPVTIITVATAAVLKVLSMINGVSDVGDAAPQAFREAPLMDTMAKTVPAAAPMEEAVRAVAESGAMADSAPMLLQATNDGAMNATANATMNATLPQPATLPYDHVGIFGPEAVARHSLFSNELILAFLVGGLFAIGVLVLIAYIRHRKR